MQNILRALLIGLLFYSSSTFSQVYQAGHPSLQHWLLPSVASHNEQNKALASLGKQLFFDERLSSSGKVSCSSCHIPEKGWEDGLVTAVRLGGKKSRVHTQTLVNVAYQTIFTWNGRAKTLEFEAYAALGSRANLNAHSNKTFAKVIVDLKAIPIYSRQFKSLFPERGISKKTIAEALAAFERTILSDNSLFDQWIKGDKNALTNNQVAGFQLFSEKAQCILCHQAPNFTDDGFHNIGLQSFDSPNHLLGRKEIVPLAMLDGAFKTPTLRDIALRAPYFHDGSAKDLSSVMKHYLGANQVKKNLSPSINLNLELTKQEKSQIIEFLKALTSQQKPFQYPNLPGKR